MSWSLNVMRAIFIGEKLFVKIILHAKYFLLSTGSDQLNVTYSNNCGENLHASLQLMQYQLVTIWVIHTVVYATVQVGQLRSASKSSQDFLSPYSRITQKVPLQLGCGIPGGLHFKRCRVNLQKKSQHLSFDLIDQSLCVSFYGPGRIPYNEYQWIILTYVDDQLILKSITILRI